MDLTSSFRCVRILLATLACFGGAAGGQVPAFSLRWNGLDAEIPLEGTWIPSEGRHYFVETSRDLTDWPLLHRLGIGDETPAVWPLPQTRPASFFRLLEFPPPAHEWVTVEATTALARWQLFMSGRLGRPVSFHVMLPPSYAAQPSRNYPVLYWLHGSGAGVTRIPQLCSFFENAMLNGNMPHALIVFANGLESSMWCDSKDGTIPMESIVIEELIPHVDRSFRTIPSREGRIVEGFSMGGHGAGRLGLKFASHFRALSMLGAGPLQLDFLEMDPDLQPIKRRQILFAEIYGNDADYYLAQHPHTWAEVRAGNLPANHRIRIIIGTADSMLANNREFRDHLTTLGIPHTYLELPGVGHNALQALIGAGNATWTFYQETLGTFP
jgi:enterochelin esterase-like enzyme